MSGTGGVSTFTLMGVTSSLDTIKMAAGGPDQFEGYDVPYGIAPVPWTLHFAHPQTRMNLFASQYGDFSLPFSASGHYDTMWRHNLAAGVRFGWIAKNNNSTPAGTSYTKYYYLQFGTENSTRMPNFSIGSGPSADANFTLGDAYANDYRTPATLSFTTGSQSGDGYDEGQGVYTMNASGNVADFTFNVGSYTRHHPRFYVANFTGSNGLMKIGGVAVNPSLYAQTVASNVLLVQYLGDVTANSTLRFESASVGTPVAEFVANRTTGWAPLAVDLHRLLQQHAHRLVLDLRRFRHFDLRNPTHTYTSTGSFTVALTSTNGSGNNTCTKNSYLSATTGTAPVANFWAAPTSAAAPPLNVVLLRHLHESADRLVVDVRGQQRRLPFRTRPIPIQQRGELHRLPDRHQRLRQQHQHQK